MKNLPLSVDGVNVAFDDDGTMRYIAMKVINMNEERRWQEVHFTIHVSCHSASCFTVPRTSAI